MAIESEFTEKAGAEEDIGRRPTSNEQSNTKALKSYLLSVAGAKVHSQQNLFMNRLFPCSEDGFGLRARSGSSLENFLS